jgi:hypothetical protein
MADSEKKIEVKLTEMVKAKGGLCVKYPAGCYNGFPDRIVLMPQGQIFFVELKSEGKRPSLIQKHVHSMLAALGFTVLVIDKLEQVDRLKEII